jgi:Xaa-Pro aminopeptidase
MLKNENAIYYECGFSCDNVIFLKFGSEAFFITDTRYETEVLEYIKDAKVVMAERRNMYPTVVEYIKKANIKEIIYDPREWSILDYKKIIGALEGEIEFKEEINFSHKRRIIKSEDELDILREAADIGAKAFDKFAKFLNENGLGLSEQRLHYEAEKILKDEGKYGLSFSPILGFGLNAAKCHALPLEKTLSKGELVLFDAGVTYKGYCSDRTRTAEFDGSLNFSKSQTFSSAKKQKIYDTVLKSQEAGIKNTKPGVKACEIDLACREVIEKAGFGELFIHSTGHGVGLDVHELPIISKESETILEEGMVFTIEPGIYLPEEFGVRIEDTLIVTSDGYEVLGK